MDVATLVAELLGGIIGGSYAASKVRPAHLGTTGNWLTGAIGGLIGGGAIGSAMDSAGHASAHAAGLGAGLDVGTAISLLAGSGLSGGLMTLAVGGLRAVLAR